MATALRKLEHVTFEEFTVAAGQAATIGELAVMASDTTVQDAGGASDLGIGVFATTEVAGARVAVMLLSSSGVIPVACGTGGCTRGTKAIAVADGFTDAPAHDSDGTGNSSIYGVFMQSGVVGDVVGMMPCIANRGNA